MLVSPPVRRAVERVPPLEIALLGASGLLPRSYAPHRTPAREITFADVGGFEWLVDWGGGRVYGYAAYRDGFDLHTGSDVREIASVEGSKRACVVLLRALAASAREHGRRIVGAVDSDNELMVDLFERMGYVETRRFFEDAR